MRRNGFRALKVVVLQRISATLPVCNGQRGWDVPLTAWSETVVAVNCELAYIGAARKRGLNSEANLADFRAREEQARQWCREARDRMITPDQRLSQATLGTQAVGYYGPRARGWDGPPRR